MDDLGQAWCPWCDDFASNNVGVDDWDVMRCEDLGDRGFSTCDASSKSNNFGDTSAGTIVGVWMRTHQAWEVVVLRLLETFAPS